MSLHAEAPRISLSNRKKIAFSVTSLAVFLVAMEGVLALFGFDSASVRRDPYAGFCSTTPLFSAEKLDGEIWYRTSRAKLKFFNEQAFPAEKKKNTTRVFCLGGSTTFGRPFDDRTSYVNWLRQSLRQLAPDQNWEVINAGGISYASYRIVNLMEEAVRYEPDWILLYTGHNEYLEERSYDDFRFRSNPAHEWLSPLAKTRTVGFFDQLLRGDSETGANLKGQSGIDSTRTRLPSEVDAILDHSVGPDAYTRESFDTKEVASHFGYNLRQIVKLAHDCDARVLLISPAANIKDFSPFKSEHSADFDWANNSSDLWLSTYLDAKSAFQRRDFSAAIDLLESANQLDPGRAEAHFLLGQSLFGLQRHREANQSFQAAIELDICPLRATKEMVDLVERVAMENQASLIQLRSVLESDCLESYGHKSLGSEYFLDHVHPTVATHGLIASAILDAMKASDGLAFTESEKRAALELSSREIGQSVDQSLQAKALTNLAQVLGWAGKQSEAAPLALKAVEIQTSLGEVDPESLFYASVHHAVMGRDEIAIDLLRRLLEVDSQHFEARWRLASLLYDQGLYQESVMHYRMANQINPLDLSVRRMLGFALLRNQQTREAELVFLDYLQSVPEDEVIGSELERLRVRDED